MVSAKLFISYMGTNTAKDFKVRKKTTFIKLSSSGDDQPWFGGGGWAGKPWTDQLSLLSHQVKQLTAKTVDSKTLI